jgi:hypothetical protein
MLVDARGTHEDSGLVATRVHVGNRTDEPISVEFAGTITAVDAGKLTVDTEGGSSAIVLTSSTTQIIGTPAVGAFAEVRGTLNASLEVVASRVRIKASREADDEEREERERQNRGNNGNNGRGEGRGGSGRPDEDDDDGDADEFEREIRLVPAAGSTVHGSAEVEFEQEGTMIKQKLEIKLEGAAPSTEYRIRVSAGSVTLDFGSIRTNTAGKAEVNFTAVPEGKTVRDFTGVQIVNAAGAVVAQGTF